MLTVIDTQTTVTPCKLVATRINWLSQPSIAAGVKDNTMNWRMLLLILLPLVYGQEQPIKVWRKNANWENKENWAGETKPECSRDTADFTAAPRTTIFLSGNSAVKGILLASDMAFVLGNDLRMTLGASVVDSSTCSSSQKVFQRGADLWHDPRNWLHTEHPEEPNPVPHLERIPCHHDAISFPRDSTFKVELPPERTWAVNLGKVKYGDDWLTGDAWRKFLNSTLGKSQFTEGSLAKLLMGQACPEPSGCVCGNAEMRDVVCGLVKNTCPQLTCDTPIRPEGSCCDICGSYLTVQTTESTITLQTLKDIIKTALAIEDLTSVRSYTSKISAVEIQVVLVHAEGQHGKTISAAEAIESQIRKMLPKNANVAAFSSSSTGLGFGGGLIFLIVLLIVLAAAGFGYLGIYLYQNGYYRIRIPIGHLPWVHFNNDPTEATELSGEHHIITASWMEPHDQGGEASGFNNPIYCSDAPEKDGGVLVRESEIHEDGTTRAIENPIYQRDLEGKTPEGTQEPEGKKQEKSGKDG
ncbi:unnamed protein product [Darwinula stevensoni]|uniref:Protein amnionless n=1 Tax=Darwinula stevensoni TaxID=69355 RepID=A0A7R8XEL1_9CRUS|nr:unnamed protein product [Darwinula stevensoni]CAG0890756.1 unnamed protein product [Darwinula stevensoni]